MQPVAYYQTGSPMTYGNLFWTVPGLDFFGSYEPLYFHYGTIACLEGFQ